MDNNDIFQDLYKLCGIHNYIHTEEECPFCAGILFHCDKHPLQVFATNQRCLACQEEEANGS
jgi:hypothetical protein